MYLQPVKFKTIVIHIDPRKSKCVLIQVYIPVSYTHLVIFCNKGIGVGVRNERCWDRKGPLCAGKGCLKGSGTNKGMSIDREHTY